MAEAVARACSVLQFQANKFERIRKNRSNSVSQEEWNGGYRSQEDGRRRPAYVACGCRKGARRAGSYLQRQVALLGGAPSKKRGRPAGGAVRASTLKGRKVPPRYRGPDGETWAGRGAQPQWLTALLKEGHSLENFPSRKEVKQYRPRRRSWSRRRAGSPQARREGANGHSYEHGEASVSLAATINQTYARRQPAKTNQSILQATRPVKLTPSTLRVVSALAILLVAACPYGQIHGFWRGAKQQNIEIAFCIPKLSNVR